MTRFPDWPDRLHAFLDAANSRRFSWGRHDCALFACDAALAITGDDLAAPLRGRYETALGAARALKRFAGGELAETAEKIAADHGIAEVPVTFAQRGDIALVDADLPEDADDRGAIRHALAVVMAGHLFAPHLEQGLTVLPLSAAKRVWAVGR